MNSSAFISAQNLSAWIGDKKVLSNLTFTVSEGELVALVGPNGAGKSTLLRAIVKLIGTIDGELSVLGRSVREISQRELARAVSYVPQLVSENISLTVYEFLTLSRYPYLSPFERLKTGDIAIIEGALETLALGEFRTRRMNSLSGGERQKVLVASALVQQPRVMILDEPSTFLDPKHLEAIFTALRNIAKRDRTAILLVTHDINNAIFYTDSIIALKSGALMFRGRTNEFTAGSVLESVYDKRFVVVTHPHKGIDLVVPGDAP